jgi:hypothetical protein
MTEPTAPACVECGTADNVALVLGTSAMPEKPDFCEDWFWTCSCSAMASCYPGTKSAVSRPGRLETRRARFAAHDAFDPMWMRKIERDRLSATAAKRAGRVWLAGELGIPAETCEIEELGEQHCLSIVEIIDARRRRT